MAIIKLGDIGIFKGGISTLKKERYGKGILFVNYMDIFNNLIIDSNKNMKYYDASEKDYQKYFLEKGDILFTASSETIEEIAISSLYWLEEKAIFNGFSKVFKYDKNILLPKYAAYYFRTSSIRCEFKKYATGYTRYNISQENLKRVSVTIPTINEQQIIIDIIGNLGDERFAKYSNIIRINTVENCREDVNAIFDIIEPIEKVINNLKKQVSLIKKILMLNYQIVDSEAGLMVDYINLINQKWINQKNYFATNAVSEFEIDFSKIINVESKRPSRADVTPKKGSFIFSKLAGDNKVFYFDEVPNEVFSTGFYNFTTEYVDFLAGFMLSNDFVNQKNNLSTGTTMQALKLTALSNIKLKRPINNNKMLTIMLTKKVKIIQKLNNLNNLLIKILIK